MAKISFLVTFYNQEKFVKLAIESILQIEKSIDFEILIGDDGSDDNTVKILKKYEIELGDKLRIFIMPRDKTKYYDSIRRASDNRLNILKHASGDYIMFLDGDDHYLDSMFLLDALDIFKSDSSLVACAFNFSISGKNLFGYHGNYFKDYEQFLYTGKLSRKAFLQRYYLPAASIVFKNVFLNQDLSHLKDSGIFDDTTITTYILQFGELYYINRSIFNYTQNESSIWNSKSRLEKSIANTIDLFKTARLAPMFNRELYYRAFGALRDIYKERKKISLKIDPKKLDKLLNYSRDHNLVHSLLIFQHLSLAKKVAVYLKYFYYKYKYKCIKPSFCNFDNFDNLRDRHVLWILPKRPKYVIEARMDATGIRMCSMLNAMYLARRLGLKFAFIWDISEEIFGTASFVDNNGKRIMSWPRSEEIFSKEFIDKYMLKNDYTNVKTNLDSYGYKLLEPKYKNTKSILKHKPTRWWGWYSNAENLWEYYQDCNEGEVRKEFANLYKEIKFSQRYEEILNNVESEIKNLGNDFAVIHIRSGDLVYLPTLKAQVFEYTDRLCTYEEAMYIIKTNKTMKFVIVGNDDDSNNILAKYFASNRVLSISCIVNKYNFTVNERLFFDLNFMSYASYLFRQKATSFSRFSYLISKNCKEILIDKIYTTDQVYDIILKHCNKLSSLNYCQKSLSCIKLYTLAVELNLSSKQKITHLKNALLFDPENLGSVIYLLGEYIKICDYEEADKLIGNYMVNIDNIVTILYSAAGCSNGLVDMRDLFLCLKLDQPYCNLMALNQAIIAEKELHD